MDRLRLGIVSFGFLGLSPFAPGTAGTAGAVLLAWGLAMAVVGAVLSFVLFG